MTQDMFSNPYFYVTVTSNWDSENPICDNGCSTSSSTELSSTQTNSTSSEETSVSLSEPGEIVEAPNGKKAEVQKVVTNTGRSRATGTKTVDKKEFKKHHPEKAEDDIPDELVGLPLTVTTTKEVGKYLNPDPPEKQA